MNKTIALTGALAASLALAACGSTTTTDDGAGLARPAPSTTTNFDLAQELEDILCISTSCSVDVTDAVIVVEGSEYGGPGVSELKAASDRFGFWSEADVERMGSTRALDGTLSSSDGSVTWTYHPDDGLDIVVDRTAQ